MYVAYKNKNESKMAQAKLLWLFVDMFGVPLSFIGFIANIDNIKSAIIALLSMAYLSLRGYFYFVQKKQAVREKELDLWQKEMDKTERIERHARATR